jgi:hypothetical protein
MFSGFDRSLISGFIAQLPALSQLHITPNMFYGRAGSILTAAVMGGCYGLVGRVISPKANIRPLNYVVWFSVAFQIKSLMETLGILSWKKLNQAPRSSYSKRRARLHHYFWQLTAQLKIKARKIDATFSEIFHIRPFHELNQANIEDAKFLEMCRYRIGKVFKNTLLDMISFNVAHYFTRKAGIFLPQRTIVPLFIIGRSIIKDIVIIPCLHIYRRVFNDVIASLEKKTQWDISRRIEWMHVWIPAL